MDQDRIPMPPHMNDDQLNCIHNELPEKDVTAGASAAPIGSKIHGDKWNIEHTRTSEGGTIIGGETQNTHTIQVPLEAAPLVAAVSPPVRPSAANGVRFDHLQFPAPSGSPPANGSASPSPSYSSYVPTPYHLLNELSNMKASELTNAIIHLYRGEMSRQQAYRLRLDTCTNWAVTVTAAMTVFSLGQPSIPHYFHVVICVFMFIFLLMEARRHGYYIAVKNRVRQIEAGFYGRVLMGDEFGKSMCGLVSFDEPSDLDDSELERPVEPIFISPFVHSSTARAGLSAGLDAQKQARVVGEPDEEDTSKQNRRIAEKATEQFSKMAPPQNQRTLIQPYMNDWTHILYHSLLFPEIHTSLWNSALIRLRRVYLFLFLGVLAGWIIKVHLDIGLTSKSLHWIMVVIVCALYAITVFVVAFYLPHQHRSRMHAEKHIAAMFMQERQRLMTAGELRDGSMDQEKWWKMKKAEGMRKRPSYGERTKTAIPNLPPTHPAYHLPPTSHPHLSHSYQRSTPSDIHYWMKQAVKNSMNDADV